MRAILLFLATAWLTAFCLGRILPPASQRTVEVKLGAFARHADDWSVLMLGSSQTFHGVQPALFDQRTAEHGVETRSFNLGIPGAGLAELYVYLERVAALRPKGLRWILVEAEQVMRVGEEGVFLTPKLIGMSDPTTSALVWTYFGEVEPRPKRLYAARWRTLVATAYHVAGVGRGVPWIEDLLGQGVSEADLRKDLGPAGDGYRSLEGEIREPIQTRPTRYAQRQREYKRRLLEIEASAEHPEPPHESARPFYRRIVELGRAMGTEVVFFTIRRGAGQSDAPALAREGAIGGLLEFDDPERYPELYDIDMTVDGGHFNRTGSEAFTGYLAEAFAEQAKGRVP